MMEVIIAWTPGTIVGPQPSAPCRTSGSEFDTPLDEVGIESLRLLNNAVGTLLKKKVRYQPWQKLIICTIQLYRHHQMRNAVQLMHAYAVDIQESLTSVLKYTCMYSRCQSNVPLRQMNQLGVEHLQKA